MKQSDSNKINIQRICQKNGKKLAKKKKDE